MRRKLIVGNWKMNLLRSEAEVLTKTVLNMISPGVLNCDIVLVPPYTTLEIVHRIVNITDIGLGAQNVFWENSGAYTGEISPTMLKNIGCEWVLIGHSERRQILGETDEDVRKKVLAALGEGLNVIVCVGETLLQREKGMASDIVKRQVERAFRDVKTENSSKVALAYEPIWAIGTGVNATPDEVITAHIKIREKLTGLFGNEADNVRILYGGSVNDENIEKILAPEEVDGALVGGASLDAEAFIKIVRLVGE